MTDNNTETPASTDTAPDWLIPSRVYDVLNGSASSSCPHSPCSWARSAPHGAGLTWTRQ